MKGEHVDDGRDVGSSSTGILEGTRKSLATLLNWQAEGQVAKLDA